MAIKKPRQTTHYYALLHDDPAMNDKAGAAITKALQKCADEIEKISKRYPGTGIGDTATDEKIADVFYGMIH